ncbi:DUF6473 family protein [Limimaricola pyoseonensis]|uniref:DUF6473 domain-containing protein n=1 Tax=Limimaricola pyoseonensis TaxID=521013 RepID=A0A1G7I2A8_9RHOB|nr:DUF6473 family protein [Limimaricola pyoseonensis]SDF06862.1 hypothetical protein SAMN04488567_3304 [Limimaricola pyoseonensis]
MRHERIGAPAPAALRCRYGTSRLEMRGPARRLDGRYIAFAGGAETFGPGADQPFPALVERRLQTACVNFGASGAGVEALLKDPEIVPICAGAQATVLQVTEAAMLSNRFYTVHPRRNDRFLRASSVLRALYPEVDFSEYCFVGHLLGALHETDAHRFEAVRDELRCAWHWRMRRLLEAISGPVLLLWLRTEAPAPGRWPAHVTPAMVKALAPLVQEVVELPLGASAAPAPVPAHLPAAEDHRAAAEALTPRLSRLLQPAG